MMKIGANLIPDVPVSEAVETNRAVEDLGYDICLLDDEGFMPDVYVVLATATQITSRIMLGPVTKATRDILQ